MWSFIFRRLLYNIPVYLGIVLVVMLVLRVNDPVYAALGKNPTQAEIDAKRVSMGIDRPFIEQYGRFLWDLVRLDFRRDSWDLKIPVRQLLDRTILPSLLITVPTLVTSTILGIGIALVAAYFRGRAVDKTLMILAVLGMSVSYLVYVILGQYFGAHMLNQSLAAREMSPLFATSGFDSALSDVGTWARQPAKNAGLWITYCCLPVLIGVFVSVGYDTRFYRAVMVEETGRDYIVTARAKGAGNRRVMFIHMLKNAMIPVITRVMISLPFLLEGAIVVEVYFGIPGMGRTLIGAIESKDFPVIETFTALLAGIFILSNILTDVLYALVDPRVRLS